MSSPEQFACTDCDKIFQNNVNLNKHLLKHSKDKQVDFLKPGEQWTEHEKIKYFDTLCFETLEIQKKVSDYEKKCVLLEDKLRQFPVQPTFDKSVRPSDRKDHRSEQRYKHVGREGCKGMYEDLPEDPSLPEGWTRARQKFSQKFGENKKTTVYWAPDGRFALAPANAPANASAPPGSVLAEEMLCNI